MRTWRVFAVLVALLLPGAISYAQTESCGDIVIPANFYNEDTEEERSPITDCANPFNGTEIINDFLVQGSPVTAGQVVTVPETGLDAYGYADENYNRTIARVYRHVGEDYVLTDVSFAEPTDDARKAAIADYFDTDTSQAAFYTLIYFSSDQSSYFFVDGNTFEPITDAKEGRYVIDVFRDVEDYVDRNVRSPRTPLLPGTYTVVRTFDDSPPSESSLPPHRWFSWLVPTVYAAQVVQTVTFTLAIEPPPPPAGASSVLFLPGIQSSRLYKEGLVFEDQVWPPSANFGNDIFDLAMTPTGFSVEPIYTRDVIDSSLGIGSVYGDFLNFLEEQKTAPLPIKDYLAFAYDWRFDVNDIVLSGTQYENELKAVIDELEALAANSHTGKVSVIAHSNGGLLAKAMLRELERRNQEHLVDKLVLIGVPHLGTPKAIGTLLHGYDQTDKLGGIVINAKDVREVINNMTGVYGLLPSEAYFAKVSGPMVNFEPGVSTDPYRTRYGELLDSLDEYRDFMYGEDDFGRGIDEVVSRPAKVNRPLFDEALLRHAQIYDNWTAPENIEVIEIVGVGLPTMHSVTYRTNIERKCTVVGNNQVLCIDEAEIKPFANLSRMGDATVVEASADGYGGEKQSFFVDLPDLNISRRLNGDEPVEHYNFPESEEVQNLVSQFLASSSVSVGGFISQSLPPLDNEYTIEVIDSPVRPLVADAQGRQTGVVEEGGERKIKQEIPGSQYFEFGDAKYLVMPRGLPRTTKLYGEAEGGYTLTVADLLKDDTRVTRSVLQNATVTPTMVVQYQVTDNGYGPLETDFAGDGVFEQVTDMEGKSIPISKATYADVRQAIRDVGLGKLRETALLVLLQSAERVSLSKLPTSVRNKAEEKLLLAVIQLVRQYQQRRFISQEKADGIVTMVNNL